MQDNGIYNSPQAQQNDTSDDGRVISFPNDSDTQLRDISTLLKGAPVIQQQQSDGKRQTSSAIATAEDFSQVEEDHPFARKVGPRVLLGAGFSLLLIFPLAAAFMGGSSSSDNQQAAEEIEAASEEGVSYVTPEEYAAQQAELEQYRSQRAFIDQQVDAEAINAAGQQQRDAEATATGQPAPATTTTTASSATSTPMPAPQPRPVTTVSRPAPARTAAAPSPSPVAATPVAQRSVRKPEPVDPFERRAQLQALGSYGSPPPNARNIATQSASYIRPSNPFETAYIQTIALESLPGQPAHSTSSAPVSEPTQRSPRTLEDLQYEQDATAVLSAMLTPEATGEEITAHQAEEGNEAEGAKIEPNETEATEGTEQASEASGDRPAPMAIMPGTSVGAELPYGLSWQEGMPLPEVLLLTTEDIMAGEIAVIPAGTQFLGQARIDPSSGAVTIQIMGLFGETRNIQIPRSSVIVQAENGSILTAKASDGPSSPGPNVGGFLMESFGNGLSNVVDSDDNLVIDMAGGMAETLIDNQVERSEMNAAARASRASSQPIIWTLDARPVRLTFNNFIPLSNARL